MPVKTRFNNEDFYLYPVPRDGEGYYCTFAVGEPNDDEMMRPYVKRQDGKAALYTDMECLYANAPTHLQIQQESLCGKMPETVSKPIKAFYEQQIKELVEADFQKYHGGKHLPQE